MQFFFSLLCWFLFVTSTQTAAVLLGSLAEKFTTCWRRGGLPVVVSSRRGLDADFRDTLVRKRRKIDEVDWPDMLENLEREPSRSNYRSRRCFLVKGLPENPEIATSLLKEIKRTTTRTIFSLNTPEFLNFLDVSPKVEISRVVVYQPEPEGISGLTRLPSALLAGGDSLVDEVAALAAEIDPGRDISFLIDLWRKSVQLDLDLTDSLNAALIPGVDHPELKLWTASKYAKFSSIRNFLELRQAPDRFGRRVWTQRDQGRFQSHTKFPHTRENPLFYIALLSQGHKILNGPLTTIEAFDMVETRNIVRTGNVNAMSNDGNFLEAVAAVAFVAASHRGSVSGTPIGKFCTQLVQELLPCPVARISWKPRASIFDMAGHALADLVVPFLSPVNSPWPKIDGLGNLGNLLRPENELMVDLVVEGHGIYAEMKNYRKPLDVKHIVSIVRKLKNDAKILFVITNRLQHSELDLANWRDRIPGGHPKIREVNIASLKVTGKAEIALEALPHSDPVPNCKTLVVIIPIKDLVFDA